MNTNKILQADVLDIIFDNRNKDYGAYELRKNYHKRLKKSIVIASTLLLVTLSAPLVASFFEKPLVVDKPTILCEFKITEVEMPKDPIQKNEPIEVKPVQVEVNTVLNVVPEITEAIDVQPEDLPPSKEELKDAISSTTTNESDNSTNNNVDIPIVVNNNGSGTEIKDFSIPEPDDKIYTETDISQTPEFPGGDEELFKFISSRLQYPKQALNNSVEGRVVVGFVVNKNGEIEEIKIVKGIGSGCDEEAVEVTEKMPKWKPGKNNGKPVSVYYQLPISFEIEK